MAGKRIKDLSTVSVASDLSLAGDKTGLTEAGQFTVSDLTTYLNGALSIPAGYTDEQAQDAVAAALAAGSHTNITVTYNDASNSISLAATGGGGGGSGANLTYTASSTNGVVASDTGTDATIPLVDNTNAGLMAPGQHIKLAGIESGATADMTAAEILAALVTVDGSGSGLDADRLRATTPSTFGLSLIDDADAATARTTLGLGTIATQAAASVSITGGSVTGITDLAVADGGTGASDAATARTNLGVDYTTLDERTRDVIGTALVAGSGMTITVNDVGDTITLASSGGGGGSGPTAFIFGDGSDGTATISSNTSLSSDMYYASLTINSGVTLSTNGYRLFVRDALTVSGSIADNGSTGGGTRAGTSAYNGAWGAGGGGATTGAAGAAGTGNAKTGGNGGAGGNGSGGSGGAGGSSSVAFAAVYGGNKQFRNLAWIIQPHGNGIPGQTVEGGMGGGGGGGNSTQAGGAGGSGGGVVFVAARTLAGTGTITANGGDGAAATSSNTGGGGGGGGGAVFLVSASSSHSLTVTANGGGGGAGNGTGTAGTAGVTGTVVQLLGV